MPTTGGSASTAFLGYTQGLAFYVDWDGDGAFSGDDVITSYVMEASWFLGRDYASQLTGRSIAGTCSIRLKNSDGRFNSFNTASPLYGKLLPKKKIKITMSESGSTVTMWVGYVDKIEPRPRLGGVHEATLRGMGILGQLTQRKVNVPMQTDILTSTAAGVLLDEMGLAATDYVLYTGQTTMTRWWTGGKIDGLNALQEISATEAGFVRETKDGKVQFEDRHFRLRVPYTVSQAYFSDSSTVVVAEDDFNRADSTDLGSVWDAGYDNRFPLQIVSNTIRATADGNQLETYNIPLDDDQKAQIQLSHRLGLFASFWGVALRAAEPPTVTFYGFVCNKDYHAAGQTTHIFRVVNQSFTSIASNATTWANGDVLRGEAEGSALRLYKNGTLVLSATDSTITSGRAGIWMEPEESFFHELLLDNFSISSFAPAISYKDIKQGDPLKEIFNIFEAEVQRTTVGGGTEFETLPILWTLSEFGVSAPTIPAGDTKTWWANYPNPSSPTNALAVDPWVTPVETTDYTALDSEGEDISSDISISVDKFDTAMKIQVTNNNSDSAVLTLLQARGAAVIASDPVTVVDEDLDSQAAYGERTFPVPGKFIPTTLEAQDHVGFLKGIHKDPIPVLTLQIPARRSITYAEQVMRRDIGDRITIVADNNADLGVNEDFFIESMSHHVKPGGYHMMTMECSPAKAYAGFWVLGTSQLGISTKLAF